MCKKIIVSLFGSSGINGTQIFACYCDRVLGHRYLLWLKIFAVPFLPLDPFILSLTPNTVHVPPPLLLVAMQCTHPPPLLILPSPLLLQSSSWLLLLFFTILMIWYIILATSYCYKANQRRRQALEDLYDINKPI